MSDDGKVIDLNARRKTPPAFGFYPIDSHSPIPQHLIDELTDPTAQAKRWAEGSDKWDPTQAVPPDRMCDESDEEYATKMREQGYPESRILRALN